MDFWIKNKEVMIICVSVRSHPWIAAGAEPDAHQFMSRFV
jgi:hypothetical protein